MQFGFEHNYRVLPAACFADAPPTPVGAPQVLQFNSSLAHELGLDPDSTRAAAATLFSGNELPTDAMPLAMAYAGHQFAHFVPSLGDGRAILLGEIRSRDGTLRDLQLKGAGRTPFSRSGDGRAAVGPMLREYLISEAMHALGIPTTRSLAVVATGEKVYREDVLPGAVLTRIARSHVRVGTFEYFAARGNTHALRALMHYCIDRHFPELRDTQAAALDLLRAVATRQAALIADWMSVGFIHGVMNTDNMAISGETIDYGPCAFMDHYDSQTVFSSIDHRGRYSYGNQPAIAQWNLARLAEALLAVMDATPELAVEQATAVINPFIDDFDQQFLLRFRRKLGLFTAEAEDAALVSKLLAIMQQGKADFTLTFRQLSDAVLPGASDVPLRSLFRDSRALDEWLDVWRRRLARENVSASQRRSQIYAANPAFIPRNHQVQRALDAASDRGDMQPFETLLQLAQRPYADLAGFDAFLNPPTDSERVLQTFCGT